MCQFIRNITLSVSPTEVLLDKFWHYFFAKIHSYERKRKGWKTRQIQYCSFSNWRFAALRVPGAVPTVPTFSSAYRACRAYILVTARLGGVFPLDQNPVRPPVPLDQKNPVRPAEHGTRKVEQWSRVLRYCSIV